MLVVPALTACGGDNKSNGNPNPTNGGNGGNNGGNESQTPSTSGSPVIAPSPLSIKQALAEFDKIAVLIRTPDVALLAEYEVSDEALKTRTTDIFEGIPTAPGLDQVRRLIKDDEHVLAGEYLQAITEQRIALIFGPADASTISAKEMAKLDPLHVWSKTGEDLGVTAIYKDAVKRIIALWRRL